MKAHRVLIVEDDPDMALALRMPLEASGYQVCDVRSGQEGLHKLAEFAPDLIILDAMTEANAAGLQFSLALRDPDPRSAYSAYRRVPILVVTAIPTTTSLRLGSEEAYLPVDDSVEKPVDPDVLLHKVQLLLAGL